MEDETTLEEKVNKLIQDRYLKKIKEDYKELYQNALDSIKVLQDKITSSEDVSKLNKNLILTLKKPLQNLPCKFKQAKREY